MKKSENIRKDRKEIRVILLKIRKIELKMKIEGKNERKKENEFLLLLLFNVGYCSIVFVIVFIIFLLFNLMPNFFLRLDIDINNPANFNLLQNSAALLGISSILLIFDNFRIIGFGALCGFKDMKFPMLASLFSFWIVGLGMAYILSLSFAGKGIWWGLTSGIAVGAFLFCIRAYKIARKYK